MADTRKKKKASAEDQAKTRTRILDGAAELIAEQGYAAASISKIAKKAGVLPGSIYWAFDSKEQILAAVLMRAGEQWKQSYLPDDDQTRVPPKSLEEIRTTFLEFGERFAETPEFLRLIMVVATERQSGSDEVLSAAREIRRMWRDMIENMILEFFPDKDRKKLFPMAQRLGRLTIQLLDGAFLSLQIETNELSVHDLFEEIADTLVSEIERIVSSID